MTLLQYFLIFGFFVILGLIGLERHRLSQEPGLITPQQFRIRMLGAVLMLALDVAVLAGTIWMIDANPFLQLAYWIGCLVLAMLILVVAVIDVRGLMTSYLVERHRILRGKDRDRRD